MCIPDNVQETGASPGGQSESHRGRGVEAVERTRRKTWSRTRSVVFVPYTQTDRLEAEMSKHLGPDEASDLGDRV